jgi:hypothetical protein
MPLRPHALMFVTLQPSGSFTPLDGFRWQHICNG